MEEEPNKFFFVRREQVKLDRREQGGEDEYEHRLHQHLEEKEKNKRNKRKDCRRRREKRREQEENEERKFFESLTSHNNDLFIAKLV